MLLRFSIYFLPYPLYDLEWMPKQIRVLSLEFLVFTKSKLSLQVPIFASVIKHVFEIYGPSTPGREHSGGQRWCKELAFLPVLRSSRSWTWYHQSCITGQNLPVQAKFHDLPSFIYSFKSISQ